MLKCGDRPVDPRWVLSDELIARAKGGDREALGAMFREYHPAILRYLKGVSLSNAEDVAGQVWVDAASSLRRFDGDGDDLRRWLFTIARRRMIDSFRSRSRRPEVAMAEPPARPTTGGAEDSLERLAWAEEVLRRLPPAQAEVVVLRVIVGLDVDEVAALIDKSPGAVRVLAHRGLGRIKALLAADGTVPRRETSPEVFSRV